MRLLVGTLAQNAELIAFGIGEHDPRNAALINVDPRCSKAQKPVDLGGLVVGPEVEMQSVLGFLDVVAQQEEDPRRSVGGWSNLNKLRPFVDDRPAERFRPPVPETSRVASVDP